MNTPGKSVIDWKAFLIPYSKAVQELKVKLKAIRGEYRSLNDYSPIEFVTGRVKKISSIIEKARMRNIPLALVGDFIDDIAGIRIMCQFNDDIYKVVELIKNREGMDLTVVYEKDYVKFGKKSGYKSYHMIVRYPVQTIDGKVDVLAEIQIRTLAMNFWATIEHSINYKYKGNIPEKIKERLRNAARAAGELDDEMREIRNEVIGAQLLFEQKSSLVFEITESLRPLMLKELNGDVLEFQRRLDELWNTDDIKKLELLLADIYEYSLKKRRYLAQGD